MKYQKNAMKPFLTIVVAFALIESSKEQSQKTAVTLSVWIV